MCTLSVLRRPTSIGDNDDEPPLWRVTFNRDERRTRPPALPPSQHIYDDRSAVHPIDPLGGGTWIAASSAGLVFTLLNGYSDGDSRPHAARAAHAEHPEHAAHTEHLAHPAHPAHPAHAAHAAHAAKSRGLIIPALLSADTLDLATTRLQTIDPSEFLSFRLVIVADDGAHEAVSDGRHLECRDMREDGAWMRSSSSLRPEVVLPHRRAMFEQDVAPSLSPAAQDRFHLTRHATDSALGVLMERDDARTVSVTTVEMFATHVRMIYRPLEPDAMTATVDIARA